MSDKPSALAATKPTKPPRSGPRTTVAGDGPPPFQRFLDAHREDVWRFLVASVGHEDADDCFQETFVSALRAYPRLRAGSNLRAWVLTIAHRKALDAHRGRARRALPVAEIAEIADGDDRGSLPTPARDETLWDAVHELPPRQRSAILLRYVADLPHRDIATTIGCSEEAARRSLHEGLTKLRKAMRMTSRRTSIEQLLRRGPHRTWTPAAMPSRPPPLTERIAEEGLADISYAPVDSPFGTLHAATTKRGLVRVAFPEESDRRLPGTARPATLAADRRVARARSTRSSASWTSTSPGAGAPSIWRSTGL